MRIINTNIVSQFYKSTQHGASLQNTGYDVLFGRIRVVNNKAERRVDRFGLQTSERDHQITSGDIV